MRQIYKDIIIGFIFASFVFSPTAFAKPTAPSYKGLVKEIKKSKGKVKLSSFLESAKPMLKKTAYRDMIKMSMPFWDKKVSEMVVGSDYFKVNFQGTVLFARYVDRGPVAFMVNNKPLLWKDFLTYTKMKTRLKEILTGEKQTKKYSIIDRILNEFNLVTEAFACGPDKCASNCSNANGTLNESTRTCVCNEGLVVYNMQNGEYTSETSFVVNNNIGIFDDKDCRRPEGTAVVTEPVTAPPATTTTTATSSTRMNWGPILAIGGVLLLLILLMKKKKKKKDPKPKDPDTPVKPEPPVPGWSPEGTCPTVGDGRICTRGKICSEKDLPPECIKTSCASSGTCGTAEPSSGSGWVQ